jgi:hypothetical protein
VLAAVAAGCRWLSGGISGARSAGTDPDRSGQHHELRLPMSGGWQRGEFVMQVQSYGQPPGWWTPWRRCAGSLCRPGESAN